MSEPRRYQDEDMIDFAARSGRIMASSVGRRKAERARLDQAGRDGYDRGLMILEPVPYLADEQAGHGGAPAPAPVPPPGQDDFDRLWPPSREAVERADAEAIEREAAEWARGDARRAAEEAAVEREIASAMGRLFEYPSLPDDA